MLVAMEKNIAIPAKVHKALKDHCRLNCLKIGAFAAQAIMKALVAK